MKECVARQYHFLVGIQLDPTKKLETLEVQGKSYPTIFAEENHDESLTLTKTGRPGCPWWVG